MPQCGRSTRSQDKGAVPVVLYYSDNRRKVVTNELDRPCGRKHINIHYLPRDALLHHAQQRTEGPVETPVKISISVSPAINPIPRSFIRVPFYICQTRLDRDETPTVGQPSATLIYLRNRCAMSAKLQ